MPTMLPSNSLEPSNVPSLSTLDIPTCSNSLAQTAFSNLRIGSTEAIAFDLRVKDNGDSIAVQGLSLRLQSFSDIEIRIWTKSGSWNSGSNFDSSGWTEVHARSDITGAGSSSNTDVGKFSDEVVIGSGETQSFLIWCVYTNGLIWEDDPDQIQSENGDLAIENGLRVFSLSGDNPNNSGSSVSSANSAGFQGEICYGNAASTPNPSSVPSLSLQPTSPTVSLVPSSEPSGSPSQAPSFEFLDIDNCSDGLAATITSLTFGGHAVGFELAVEDNGDDMAIKGLTVNLRGLSDLQIKIWTKVGSWGDYSDFDNSGWIEVASQSGITGASGRTDIGTFTDDVIIKSGEIKSFIVWCDVYGAMYWEPIESDFGQVQASNSDLAMSKGVGFIDLSGGNPNNSGHRFWHINGNPPLSSGFQGEICYDNLGTAPPSSSPSSRPSESSSPTLEPTITPRPSISDSPSQQPSSSPSTSQPSLSSRPTDCPRSPSCFEPFDKGNFNICLDYDDSLDARYRSYAEQAAAKWVSAITSSYTTVSSSNLFFDTECSCGYPEEIDDLYICIVEEDIDGSGNTLGTGGPDNRSGGLTRTGTVTMDIADRGNILGGIAERVLLHEMGHVLGIGPSWGSLRECDANGDCVYQDGTNAKSVWEDAGCTDELPLQYNGGGHWNETCFGNELMTSTLNGGSSNFLTDLSIASLEDLGYGVNYGAAEASVSSVIDTDECCDPGTRRLRQGNHSCKRFFRNTVGNNNRVGYSVGHETDNEDEFHRPPQLSLDSFKNAKEIARTKLQEKRNTVRKERQRQLVSLGQEEDNSGHTTEVEYVGDQFLYVFVLDDYGDIHSLGFHLPPDEEETGGRIKFDGRTTDDLGVAASNEKDVRFFNHKLLGNASGSSNDTEEDQKLNKKMYSNT